MDFIRTLGDTVKKARKRLGLTQLKAAEICSIDSRTILNIENYRGNPKWRFCSLWFTGFR